MMQESLADYLLNAAWQAPVVALCALIVTRFGGLSPRTRNGVWLGLLGIAVILPAIAPDRLLPRAQPVVARVPVTGRSFAPTLERLRGKIGWGTRTRT